MGKNFKHWNPNSPEILVDGPVLASERCLSHEEKHFPFDQVFSDQGFKSRIHIEVGLILAII